MERTLLFSIDNRRLIALNAAGVEKAPVEVVTLDSPQVAVRFGRRFDPIGSEGKFLVVATSAQRESAQELLVSYGKIKGVQLGNY